MIKIKSKVIFLNLLFCERFSQISIDIFIKNECYDVLHALKV